LKEKGKFSNSTLKNWYIKINKNKKSLIPVKLVMFQVFSANSWKGG
jgi:hypothetical protein